MPKLVALFCFLVAGNLCGQAVLAPPFGLKWGDSPDPLLDWANKHRLDIGVTMTADQPELRVFRISASQGALPSSKARALEGHFLAGRLIEITLHHGRPGERADAIEKRFLESKRELTAKHGKLTANQQQRKVEDQFATRTVSLHREPVQGLFLMLAFSEIEDLLRKSSRATFSIIYRNDNLKQRIERDLSSRRDSE